MGGNPLDLKAEGDALVPSLIIWSERKLLEPDLDTARKATLQKAVDALRDASHL